MRDKILNILGVLSQSLQKNKDLFYDAKEIWEELSCKGFSADEIESALEHIEKTTLCVPGPFWSDAIPVYRSFTLEENLKISKHARGFLWKLKCRGIINHALEDEIIQKAMEMDDCVSCREIKTVAALTIFGYEHKIPSCRREVGGASRLN